MDAQFWRKVAGGIAIGGVLGSIIPAAATLYLWDQAPTIESLLETPGADESTTEEAESRQKTAQKSRKRIDHASKRRVAYEPTAPKKRDTEADKLADVIMAYIEARKNSPEPNQFQSYYEYATDAGHDLHEIPLQIYQNDRHYLLGEERFVEELYFCFLYEDFGCIELLLPTEEDNFSRDFRRRTVEEIARHYEAYLDRVIEKTECSKYESDLLFNRMMYFSLFPQRHEDVPFAQKQLAALREKEKETCLKCDFECTW